MTQNSLLNHSYVRRVLGAKDPFSLFWADGNPQKESPSHLYFGTRSGEQYWRLPYDMTNEFVTPVLMKK